MDPIDQMFTKSVAEDVARMLPKINSATTPASAPCQSNYLFGIKSSSGDGPPDQTDFGDLADKFVIFLGYQPHVSSAKYIDEVVGDPTRLEESTQVKFDAIGPRLTFAMLSESLDRAGQRAPMPGEPTKYGAAALFQDWTSADSKQVRGNMMNIINDQFNGRERIDLEVYALTQSGLVTPAGWDKFKNFLVNNDGYVMLGVLAGQAASNQGDIRTSGYFLEKAIDGERKIRVGWYARAQEIGTSWRPKVSSGLVAATPGFEAKAGISHRVSAQSNEERTGLDFSLEGHRYDGFGRNWEAQGKASFHQTLTADTPNLPGSKTLTLEAYGRRAGFMGHQNYTLILSSGVTRDFSLGVTDKNASVGVENARTGTGTLLRFRDNEDPTTHLRDRYIGIAFGGNFKWTQIMHMLGRD